MWQPIIIMQQARTILRCNFRNRQSTYILQLHSRIMSLCISALALFRMNSESPGRICIWETDRSSTLTGNILWGAGYRLRILLHRVASNFRQEGILRWEIYTVQWAFWYEFYCYKQDIVATRSYPYSSSQISLSVQTLWATTTEPTAIIVANSKNENCIPLIATV